RRVHVRASLEAPPDGAIRTDGVGRIVLGTEIKGAFVVFERPTVDAELFCARAAYGKRAFWLPFWAQPNHARNWPVRAGEHIAVSPDREPATDESTSGCAPDDLTGWVEPHHLCAVRP